jgi:hypothetical protein
MMAAAGKLACAGAPLAWTARRSRFLYGTVRRCGCLHQRRSSQPETTAARLPRITRLLALAVRFEGLLQDGTVRDYADLARLGGVSRARITQIMSLRSLAPVIQERILALPGVSSPIEDMLNERLLRGVAQRYDWREQMRMWGELIRQPEEIDKRRIGRRAGRVNQMGDVPKCTWGRQ